MTRPWGQSFWFYVKTGPPDECWEWTGGRIRKGYGRFGGFGKSQSAHRVAYELSVGPIPDGLHVLHRCDNPPCCNPRHLWLGTNADNIHDAISKGRVDRSKFFEAGRQAAMLPRPCISGAMNPSAKLTNAQVAEIRSRWLAGERNKSALGRDYDVSHTTIRHIVEGDTWLA